MSNYNHIPFCPNMKVCEYERIFISHTTIITLHAECELKYSQLSEVVQLDESMWMNYCNPVVVQTPLEEKEKSELLICTNSFNSGLNLI